MVRFVGRIDHLHGAARLHAVVTRGDDAFAGGKTPLNESLAEAIAVYREALEHRGRDPKLYNNMGGALEESGDLEGAVLHYRIALKLDPGFQVSRGALAATYRDRRDRAGAEAVRQLVAQHGSPLLVLDCDVLRRRYRELCAALPGVGLYYAIKSLPHRDAVAALLAEGAAWVGAGIRRRVDCRFWV